MTVPVRAVRGATRPDGNTPAEIGTACTELVSAVLARNGLDADQVVSIVFTSTDDLNAQFPALAVAGLDQVPMLCARELDVPGGPARTVRMLAHVESARSRSEIQHVYLRGTDTGRSGTTIPEGT